MYVDNPISQTEWSDIFFYIYVYKVWSRTPSRKYMYRSVFISGDIGSAGRRKRCSFIFVTTYAKNIATMTGVER